MAPIGTIDVANTFVRTGKKVVVSWEIIYPAEIGDLLRFGPSGRIETRQDVTMTVQAIGMEYQSVSHDNGHGNNTDGVDITNPGQGRGGPNGAPDLSAPLDDELQTNGHLKVTNLELDATLWIAQGGTWSEVFQGSASSLRGDVIYHQSSLPMGATVDLAAQGKGRGAPNPVISTTTANPNLIVLKNGDPLPAGVAAFQTGQIAGFLSPYIENGTIRLGPTQALYLFDLDATPGAPGFNLQDLGVLVTVTPNAPRTVRP